MNNPDTAVCGDPPFQGNGSKARPGKYQGLNLNLGCGGRFHPAWTNVDLHPQASGVQRRNVQEFPWPWPENTFEMVYCSHLLEHLPPEIGQAFVRECYRVLRPGGVLRVVVPDLEQIARLYLEELERAAQGDDRARQRHAWMTLELLDQMTRQEPGGRMRQAFQRGDALIRSFAQTRLGVDAAGIQDGGEEPCLSFWQRCLRRLWGWLRGSWRERVIRWLLGKEYACLRVGRFRMQGEVHQWMYDRVSLAELLRSVGFKEICPVDPRESQHLKWHEFQLDLDADGLPAKPDSLYLEGRKEG